MPGGNPEMLLLWIAAAAAGVLVFAFALVLARPRIEIGGALTRAGAVSLAAALSAAVAWAYIDRANLREHDAERRALELRAQVLNAGALAPGSPLACLDAIAGDTVEAACERELFAAPATVAEATSYVAARFALLADMVAFRKHGDAQIDDALLPLRRSLETDRFGFLAHLLQIRDGCTSADCKILALLRDPGRVRANLADETLDHYLDRYSTAWAQAPDGAVADATPMEPAHNVRDPHKVTVNIDFPSAASIPPVSIMNPEPATKTPAAGANANSASRRSRKQSGNAQAAAQAAAQAGAPELGGFGRAGLDARACGVCPAGGYSARNDFRGAGPT